MMKNVIWILTIKTAEMYFSPLIYSELLSWWDPFSFTSKAVYRQNPPATDVDARLIFTLPLCKYTAKDETAT